MRRLLLRLLAATPTATDHTPDAELLRRFIASNDAAAFELIVRRHAGAVWAAAFHILKNEADAEDAFQASFLALIRNAKQVRATCLGGWLHRVAVNAALKLRERTVRISSIASAQLEAILTSPSESPDAELASVVHEELAQLSERERLPLVLCDLEGMSHADAAKALGWRVGTVSGRLSRARAKLRERLARRGVVPASTLLPALVAPPQLIPNVLSLTTGAASPAVVSLTEGVLAMNATTTWKWVAVAMVCIGVAGAGTAIGLTEPGVKPTPVPEVVAPPPVVIVTKNPAPPNNQPADADWLPKLTDPQKLPPSAFPELTIPEGDPNDPDVGKTREENIKKTCPRLTGQTAITISPTDNTLQKLLKARLHQGILELQRYSEVARIGNWNATLLQSQQNVFKDIQAVATELWSGQPKELVPWLEELVVMAKEFERFYRIRESVGSSPAYELNAASRYRLSLEAALWKAKNGK